MKETKEVLEEMGVPIMPETPECERMRKVMPQSQRLGEFLDWLNEQGIHLATYERWEGYRDEMLTPYSSSYEQLLARYFEIDLAKVETEKRALLEWQRAMNEWTAKQQEARADG